MGLFIQVQLNKEKCRGIKQCRRCIEICPVDIFRENKRELTIDGESEDECILCNLCLEKCPQGALTIKRLYEEKLSK